MFNPFNSPIKGRVYESEPIISHAATKIKQANPITSIESTRRVQPFLLLILFFPIISDSKSKVINDLKKPFSSNSSCSSSSSSSSD